MSVDERLETVQDGRMTTTPSALTPAPTIDLDLFAGPGGWDEGRAQYLGLDRRTSIGIEWDTLACETARAAGHRRVQADVSADSLTHWGRRYRGLIGSPPCQGFSPAGKGLGRLDAERLIEAARMYAVAKLGDEGVVAMVYDNQGDVQWVDPREWAREHMRDHRSLFALEPLRYAVAAALAGQPFEWLAWEQVAPVLVLWEACADVLREYGYDARAEVVNAEAFGVPQTRKRAILRATLHRPLPDLVPTHSRYNTRTPSKLEDGMPRWVSMAEALGWGMNESHPATHMGDVVQSVTASMDNGNSRWVQRSNYSTGSGPGGTAAERGRTIREGDQPSVTVTSKGFQWQEVDRDAVIAEVEPRVNNQSGTTFDLAWPADRPSPTVAGRDLVGMPGPNANRYNGSTKSRNDGVRVTVAECAVLQTFPADYPWQGNKGDQHRQVGDAVPPLLAAHIIGSLMGIKPEV